MTAALAVDGSYGIEAHDEFVLIWIRLQSMNIGTEFFVGLKEVWRRNKAPDAWREKSRQACSVSTKVDSEDLPE